MSFLSQWCFGLGIDGDSHCDVEKLFSENMPDALTLCTGERLATAVGHAYVQAGGTHQRFAKDTSNGDKQKRIQAPRIGAN